MVKAEFIASGSETSFALDLACELTAKIYLMEQGYGETYFVDVRCDSLKDAESLDELMWEKPKNVFMPHQLIHNGDKLIKINIGYPGTIFSKEKQKSLINISPDLPGNIKDYDYFYQLVIEDNGILRERAAKTWSACKKEGLNPQFKKWQ